MRAGAIWKYLYLLLNFVMNLRLLYKLNKKSKFPKGKKRVEIKGNNRKKLLRVETISLQTEGYTKYCTGLIEKEHN